MNTSALPDWVWPGKTAWVWPTATVRPLAVAVAANVRSVFGVVWTKVLAARKRHHELAGTGSTVCCRFVERVPRCRTASRGWCVG